MTATHCCMREVVEETDTTSDGNTLLCDKGEERGAVERRGSVTEKTGVGSGSFSKWNSCGSLIFICLSASVVPSSITRLARRLLLLLGCLNK